MRMVLFACMFVAYAIFIRIMHMKCESYGIIRSYSLKLIFGEQHEAGASI